MDGRDGDRSVREVLKAPQSLGSTLMHLTRPAPRHAPTAIGPCRFPGSASFSRSLHFSALVTMQSTRHERNVPLLQANLLAND